MRGDHAAAFLPCTDSHEATGNILDVFREILTTHVGGTERHERIGTEYVGDSFAGPIGADRGIHYWRSSTLEHDCGGEAVGSSDCLSDALHFTCEQRTRLGGRRANCPAQLNAVRNDVRRASALDRAYSDDAWLGGIELARHYSLQRTDERACSDDGIARLVRTRTVRAGSGECDAKGIRGCGERALLRDDLPHLEPAIDVATEDRAHRVEHTGREDGARAFTNFLRRLKDYQHVTTRGRLEQQARRGNGPARVHVVAARVHHAVVTR